MVNSNFPLPSLNRDTAFSDPSENVFIALGWRSEMTVSFHEYTYQDPEYIIRARNTKPAQCTIIVYIHTYGNEAKIISSLVHVCSSDISISIVVDDATPNNWH